MKRELLLSALIATSPLCLIGNNALAGLRADLLTEYQNEFGLILSSKSTLSFKGQKVFALVTVDRGNFKEKSGGNNKIHFELKGTMSLVNEKNETVETIGDYDDGEVMFDLAADDEFETKYIGYACSSTYTACGAAAEMILRFVKSEKTWSVSFDKMIQTESEQIVDGNEDIQLAKTEVLRVRDLPLEVLKRQK